VKRLLSSLAFVLIITNASFAQQDPEGAEEHVSLRYGREARAQGDFTAAYEHFLFGLARASDSFSVVQMLLENAALAENTDAQALWAHELYAYGADARGRLNLKKNQQKWMLKDDPWPAELAGLRASAVQELVKFRDRHANGRGAGDPFLAEWAEDLARSLALSSPALQEKYAANLTPTIEVSKAVQRRVLKALGNTMRKGFAESKNEWIIRAARCLRGLGAQSNFPDLEGPEPLKMSSELAAANASLGRARASLEVKKEVLTIENLEGFDEEMQRAFTLDHASFADPGVAFSKNKRYRVETSCGYWTLLGVASTVEEHHERLVAWYGEDPFLQQQGTMRMVPESHGLEMEGAGFWWVGGFQGGDITTISFTLSTIPGVGRTITHELTHRFDGKIFGGLPAWLAEGRAVWTGASYGAMSDREFVDDYVNFGTMFSVSQKGYGGSEKLSELVDGTIEEYRDNYSAGYALFVYLRSWTGFEDGETKIFRAQLEAYQRDKKRSRSGGLAGFVRYFCDGKEGRPSSFDAFTKDYNRFLKGFYWKDMQPWTARYDPGAPQGEPAQRVMDEPTATWLRNRAEPWFGQDQARMGAEVLVESGADREALAAYQWALAVDEPSDAVLDEIAQTLERVDEKEAAWAIRHWHRFDSPRRNYRAAVEAKAAPFLGKLSKTKKLVEAMAQASEFYAEGDLLVAAAVMAADHDRLAQSLGLAQSPVLFPADRAKKVLHPVHRPGHQLGAAGWMEDGLTGHEDNRVEGLWFVDRQGDLHVGRKEARSGTDTMDRESQQRGAFVLSREWQDPGRYRLRTKIEQTTTYFHGGVVLGWTRRDRNIRFDFAGGDAQYASGESENRTSSHGFHWTLDGLYARQPRVSGNVGFDREKRTWDLELRVDGPTVEVFVNGNLAGRMTTLDARPIQGYIGFYTSTGAIRVVAPELERRDREAYFSTATALGMGLHPTQHGKTNIRDLLGRPVTGLPLAGPGTALVWFPEESAKHLAELEEGEWVQEIQKTLDLFLEQWMIEDPSQGVTVVWPESIPQATRDKMQKRYEKGEVEDITMPRGGIFFATHPGRADLMESGMTVGGWKRPIIMFADPAGILQFARRLSRTRSGLHRDLLGQLLEFQDHSRPGQAGSDD